MGLNFAELGGGAAIVTVRARSGIKLNWCNEMGAWCLRCVKLRNSFKNEAEADERMTRAA